MNSNKRLHEDYEVGSRFLVQLLGECKTENQRHLILRDFLTKSQHLPPDIRIRLAFQALGKFAPSNVYSLMESKIMSPSSEISGAQASNKKKLNVLIVTVIQTELLAAKIALNIPVTQRENNEIHGIRFWETTITQESSSEFNAKSSILNIGLMMVGEARNLPCALACDRAFHAYDVETCVLVGIAAGLKSKVQVGDVVLAETVLDYESARLESTGAKKRPVQHNLQTRLKRSLEHYRPEHQHWLKKFQIAMDQMRRLPDMKFPSELTPDWRPEYHTGVVLAGEKLIADGSLPEMQEEYHERVRAGEMEGSGFAQSCIEYGIPWMVVRGVSDYGDADKPAMKLWQPVAALSAAVLAIDFLCSDYRMPDPQF